jgi:hypothetical protein
MINKKVLLIILLLFILSICIVVYASFPPTSTVSTGMNDTVISINYPYNQIHLGNHFMVTGITTLGSGASNQCLIQTGLKTVEFIIIISSEVDTKFEIYEGAVISSNGTAITAFNNNRNSNTTPTCSVFNGPTITSYGTNIFNATTGGATTKSGGGLIHRSDQEIILKPNTNYIINGTNLGTTSEICSHQYQWYEG